MSQFRGLSRHTWNLKNSIFWKQLGVTSSNFQDCLAFMIPTTWESLKKIWEVWVTWSGWFDMELPNPQWFPYKKIPISWTKGHFRGHYLDYAYTLGQKVVDKSTRLREIGFPMECFTGFFQFLPKNIKIWLLGGWVGARYQSKVFWGFSLNFLTSSDPKSKLISNLRSDLCTHFLVIIIQFHFTYGEEKLC